MAITKTFAGYRDEVKKMLLEDVHKDEKEAFESWFDDKATIKYFEQHYNDYMKGGYAGVPSTFAYALRMEAEWAD